VIRQPKTEYTRAGDISIAYKVIGDGPQDVVMVPGYLSHLELIWEIPQIVHMIERMATFSRLIMFDKRGSGLSDPVIGAPTLDERIDDVRAVMNAVGSTQASLFGVSEGAPMSILFAATHPELISSLVLYGAVPRSTWAEDYPWATPREDLLASSHEMEPYLYEGAIAEVMAPSVSDFPIVRETFAKLQRYSSSPSMLRQTFEMFLDIDVRAILPTVSVPTLVMHREGDRAVNRRAGEWMAGQIPGAKYVQLPGIDHAMFVGDTDAILDEVEEFLTGVRRGVEVDRILATVMFIDVVGSTERAAQMGDRAWTNLLTQLNAVIRDELGRFRGVEVKTLGDGVLATFDGPARAIRCALEIAESVRTLGIEVRIGLHTGEIEITEGNDVAGIAVHIAARIGALAGAREVLVSRTVKDLVAGSQVAFADRGEHTLKGVPETWSVFEVVRP
jgi:class 3 adenylate cyclase